MTKVKVTHSSQCPEGGYGGRQGQPRRRCFAGKATGSFPMIPHKSPTRQTKALHSHLASCPIKVIRRG